LDRRFESGFLVGNQDAKISLPKFLQVSLQIEIKRSEALKRTAARDFLVERFAQSECASGLLGAFSLTDKQALSRLFTAVSSFAPEQPTPS
jgi:hypothetical protein